MSETGSDIEAADKALEKVRKELDATRKADGDGGDGQAAQDAHSVNDGMATQGLILWSRVGEKISFAVVNAVPD